MTAEKPKKALRGLFTRTEQGASTVQSPSTAAIEKTKASRVAEQCDVTSSQVAEPQIVEPQAAEQTLVPSLQTVVRNFKNAANERITWDQDQYLSVIKRIEQAQTEAFLLKGRLLEEVKRRFFENNKYGWTSFCQEKLDMSYTTANQYIRVCEEFEDLAPYHPEFGFEHFKALLPLEQSKRESLLKKASNVSVKALRQMVTLELGEGSKVRSANDTHEAKQLVRSLEQLKLQLMGSKLQGLTQQQKWQLAAACQNLSEELKAVSMELNNSTRVGAISYSSPDQFEKQSPLKQIHHGANASATEAE